jgi:imidazolonepropionase-like amidohydrolase
MGSERGASGEEAMGARVRGRERGLTEVEAIRDGTGAAASAIPDAEIGTVEAGKRADLAVLADDPLADIGALEDVTATYIDGERVA